MSQPSVRFLAFGRISEESLITTHSNENKYSDNFQREALSILKKLGLLNLKPEERQKIKTANGAWFCRANANQIACLVLCNEDYPERHAYKMVNDAQVELEKIPNFQTMTAGNLDKTLKRPLENILKQYSDLKSMDRLYAANENVSQISNVMSKNIENQIANMAKLEDTEKRSALLKDSSGLFYDNATELRKIQLQRLWRMRIIVGSIVLAIVILILWKVLS